MNVIFLYLSGIFIVLLLILIPMCMIQSTLAARTGKLAGCQYAGYADYVCTVRSSVDPLVRLGFVLSVAVACVVLLCRSER